MQVATLRTQATLGTCLEHSVERQRIMAVALDQISMSSRSAGSVEALRFSIERLLGEMNKQLANEAESDRRRHDALLAATFDDEREAA